MTEKKEVQGIDGWLLVFLVLIGGVTPVANLVLFFIGRMNMARFEARYGPTPLNVTIADWAFGAIEVAIPLFILWRMIARKEWRSVQIAVAGIWLLFVGVPVLDFVIGELQYPGSFDRFMTMVAPGLSRGAFLASGAMLYLFTAKRVANTYPRHTDLAEIFE